MKAFCVVDLSAGDGGKGSLVDALCRMHDAKLVVKFSGGPQNGHNVVEPGGRHHEFSQMGAGTFVGAHTYSSQHVLWEPWAFMYELDALAKAGIPIMESLSMFHIHEDCVIVTPWAWKLNRIKERARGAGRHGSCGRGIGETRADELDGEEVLLVKDLGGCERILHHIWDRKIAQAAPFGDAAVAQIVNEPPVQVARFYKIWAKKLTIVSGPPKVAGTVIGEASQGILIDERWGWEPYRTWTDCTPRNALEIAAEMNLNVEVIGIAPAVMTRHGAGVFVTEVANAEQRASLSQKHNHNQENPWQGPLRYGHMDCVALRYALRHATVDCLALTKWDCFTEPFIFCNAYYSREDDEYYTDIADEVDAAWLFQCEPVYQFMDDHEDRIGAIEKMLGKPIRYISTGPTWRDKEIRTKAGVVTV